MSPRSERPASTGRIPGKRARRIALGALVVVATAFIGMSTWQLAMQVFGYAPSSVPVSPVCASALKAFVESLDRGRARASLERTQEHAEQGLAASVEAQLGAVEQRCTAGKDYEGFVAAKRLRDAALAQIDEDHSKLARFRRAVDMRLSP